MRPLRQIIEDEDIDKLDRGDRVDFVFETDYPWQNEMVYEEKEMWEMRFLTYAKNGYSLFRLRVIRPKLKPSSSGMIQIEERTTFCCEEIGESHPDYLDSHCLLESSYYY